MAKVPKKKSWAEKMEKPSVPEVKILEKRNSPCSPRDRKKESAGGGTDPAIPSVKSYLCTGMRMISMLRFCARPSGVSLSATGRYSL